MDTWGGQLKAEAEAEGTQPCESLAPPGEVWPWVTQISDFWPPER